MTFWNGRFYCCHIYAHPWSLRVDLNLSASRSRYSAERIHLALPVVIRARDAPSHLPRASQALMLAFSASINKSRASMISNNPSNIVLMVNLELVPAIAIAAESALCSVFRNLKVVTVFNCTTQDFNFTAFASETIR
jgi:hypothetical protein